MTETTAQVTKKRMNWGLPNNEKTLKKLQWIFLGMAALFCIFAVIDLAINSYTVRNMAHLGIALISLYYIKICENKILKLRINEWIDEHA